MAVQADFDRTQVLVQPTVDRFAGAGAIRPAEAGEAEHTWPQPEAMQPVPGMGSAPKPRGWMAGLKGKR